MGKANGPTPGCITMFRSQCFYLIIFPVPASLIEHFKVCLAAQDSAGPSAVLDTGGWSVESGDISLMET